MKYAPEVISLLAAYPGRRFKMRHIINHVAPCADARRRSAAKIGVWRVLCDLESMGQVGSTREQVPSGAHAEYWWKSVTPSAGKALPEPAQYAGGHAS